MTVAVKLVCPLGATCEEVKDNQVHRCRWYTKIIGTDAQGVDHDQWDCAMTWLPVLQVEMSSTNRGQTQAIESLRNETIKRQNLALSQMAKSEKLIEKGDA